MAHVNSLKSIWETADSSYIQATKSGGRTLVSQKPETKYERNPTRKEHQNSTNGSECDDTEDGLSQGGFENFKAIPEEFRPSKRGKDLLKVRTFHKAGDLKEEHRQKELCKITPSDLQRKRGSKNSNSSTIQKDSKNYKKESLETEDSEQPERDSDFISDETGKQKNLSGIFFYNGSSRSESTSKAPGKCQENLSGIKNNREKSMLQNMQDENTKSKFFNSNSGQSKVTTEFNKHSFFAQNNDKRKFTKYNKKSLSNDLTAIGPNKVPFEEEGIQKITRETTVTKRIQWKSDLCRFEEPENKLNNFYEYTKTTKQSLSFVSLDNEEDDEIKKNIKKDLKSERHFCNDFSRKCSMPNYEPQRRYVNQNDKELDFSRKLQRKEKQQFITERFRKPANKFEEKYNCSKCCNEKDTIIVRHEVKVIHVNERSRNNGIFHNSRSPKQDNGSYVLNTGNRRHFGENKGKRRKESAKNGESFQKAKDNEEKTPIKISDLSAKTENIARDTVPVMDIDDSNTNAAILIESGREISGMIVGSSVAINTFLDNYEQWKGIRRVTMLLFEEFEKILAQSCNKNKRIIEVAALVSSGCQMIQYVPHPGVSIAAKVIASLSAIVTNMFASSKTAKSVGLDDFQLRLCLQRDMEATSDIYMYGLQCDLQFQETCQTIEEFHSKIKDGFFGKFVESFETGFLKEMSLSNPKHPEVFYKRFERCYKLLNDRHQSEVGEAFCKSFEDWPDALATVSCLPRRFRSENWDSSPVLKTWEEIYNLLQNDKTIVEDVLKKIQDCICVLMREQSIIDKYVMDLQRRN